MRRLMALGMLLGMGASAVAADATLDSARRCASLKDSLERLVCYDTLFASASASPTAPPAAASAPAPPAGAGAVVPAAPVVGAPGTAAPRTPTPATPVTPSPTPPTTGTAGAGTDAGFGDEMVKRSIGERAEASGPKTLSASVQALRETRPDVYRITLDNGQVWQQMDKDGLFHVAVGDTVQIDRGALGGYRMARTSKGRSGWVRVNRLK